MKNQLNAYQFWYKSSEYATTEYIYIIASSLEEAKHLFKKYGYNNFYDYDLNPIDVIDGRYFIYDHKAGVVVGQYALL